MSCKSWCWPLVQWLCSWTQYVCLPITRSRIWLKTIKCLVTLAFAPAPLWSSCDFNVISFFYYQNVVKDNLYNIGACYFNVYSIRNICIFIESPIMVYDLTCFDLICTLAYLADIPYVKISPLL